eukprot:296923-Amphidinium_carterae.3
MRTSSIQQQGTTTSTPHLDNADLPSTEQPDTTNDIPPPPGLEQPHLEPPEKPIDHYIDPTPNAMARPNNFKPTHKLTSKQPPSIVGQLDNILVTKELSLENHEDKVEKKNMETIMKEIQVQSWWQYEDDITMFSETAVKEAMNEELSQLGKRSLLDRQGQSDS